MRETAGDPGPASERVKVKRRATRGHYDRGTVDAILDEAIVCHVAVAIDGQVSVIPTAYVRDGDTVVLHGSSGNRILRALRDGADACLCVTILDGLVLARSAFHHSVNYRSVVVYGRADEVRDLDEKRRVLHAFVEQMVAGRTADSRPPTDDELRQTLVVTIPLHEASAKIRTGPPADDAADLLLSHWAGELPMRTVTGTPMAAPELDADVEPPDYLTRKVSA